MDILKEKLFNIHNKLKFNGNIKNELPEQLMALKYIQPSDSILELGGSIGRNSCIINYIINNKANHIVIEPSPLELDILVQNRDNNNLGFQIENSAISDKKLYSLGWRTYDKYINGSIPINVITFSELYKKYNIKFTTLIIDNEGNFPNMLKAFPDILDDIRLLIIEHDFNSQNDLIYFYEKMKDNNFIMVDKFLKIYKYGPGMSWSDGVKTDPIFVSVWKKQ